MTEPQYARYKDIPRAELGVMANELWTRDPKMLGIHLARYKFVAKMLAGKQRVAEIGCGDGWFSRVVSEEVGLLRLHDFDPALAREANALCFDITKGAISIGNQPYDAVYALDVMEHIEPRYEFITLLNIRKSLTGDGVFICGMPSLESQQYASKASKLGHVNCKNGDDLKKSLGVHFKNVFLFGMHDETISTAFLPMCHYLIAVCCGPR